MMLLLQSLPCEVFLRVTQSILNRSPSMASSNVIAMLCGQAQLAQVFQTNCTAHQKARIMSRILHDLLEHESQSSTTAELVVKVACEMGVKLSDESSDSKRIIAQALTLACK